MEVIFLVCNLKIDLKWLKEHLSRDVGRTRAEQERKHARHIE